HPEVHEEADEGALELATAAPPPVAATTSSSAADAVETALETLLRPGAGGEDDEAARLEAAVALHQSGTADALVRLDRRPGHERARAHLRDVRWDVVGAGAVPLFGVPGGLRALVLLFALRFRRARRLAGERWLSAAGGGAAAGLVAGVVGGTILW